LLFYLYIYAFLFLILLAYVLNLKEVDIIFFIPFVYPLRYTILANLNFLDLMWSIIGLFLHSKIFIIFSSISFDQFHLCRMKVGLVLLKFMYFIELYLYFFMILGFFVFELVHQCLHISFLFKFSLFYLHFCFIIICSQQIIRILLHFLNFLI
jgi:hypothetical protein